MYVCVSGGQNHLLLAMDIAKVDAPISCEGLYFQAMCKNRVSAKMGVP